MQDGGNQLKVFTGNAHPELAREICSHLKCELGDGEISRFSDGEIQVKINESVRGADTFVVQPTCPPCNENLMELLVMIDSLRRASANRITAVIPYYGYARQDRKAQARDPITAKLIANLLTTAGADRVLTIDLHAPQIQGFFDIPVDHLYGAKILAEYFKEKNLGDITVVAPDVGAVRDSRAFAERLDASLAIIDKRRPKPNVSEVMNVIGDVEGRNVILFDDMIDTAGTITQAAEILKKMGAKSIYACCTHPVFSGPAIQRLKEAPIDELVVLNTIPQDEGKLPKLKILSVAPLVAEAIERIHLHQSVSTLFE
ncbi:ribose-phosphate pyrophosphokinase [Anoxybacter fermentans]|uniref:Ribose-phosphate pyrophosphokinase n=1 Tax=Anoxybacter fermentans TaxID=1323375 RepID=A0A3S9T200_9FIRM|nr:ribose-phosphate pyrophosphokinase [Anoxybacter fermentans]AZR74559.1 ribose-phosphate pyrophosphokinase [Anoxybacter fermentans]